jgi:hypothetical protein
MELDIVKGMSFDPYCIRDSITILIESSLESRLQCYVILINFIDQEPILNKPKEGPKFLSNVTPRALEFDDEEDLHANPVTTATTSTVPPQRSVSPVILGSGLRGSMLEQINILGSQLGARLVAEFDPSVTHIVVVPDHKNATKRTMKYMQAVLNGCWVVSYDWILEVSEILCQE